MMKVIPNSQRLKVHIERRTTATMIGNIVDRDPDFILKQASEKSKTLPVSIDKVLANWFIRSTVGNYPDELTGIIDGDIRDIDIPKLGDGAS